MADTAISALTTDATPTFDDYLVTVNDPGGTPVNRKVTVATMPYMCVVVHGSTAATARPTGALAVYWMGDVEPDNADNGDQWYDTTGD